MSRTVEEWIGRTDDTPAPDRVKDRIVQAQDRRCAKCAVAFGAKVPPEFDHRIALINGGANRETNLWALCPLCHGTKSKADVAQKSKDARVRQKHLGIKKRKALIPGSKGSGWRKPLNGPAYRVKE
jgi:5-methylcytosine-specific restriction endonuclease McrA